jgi:ubiquinone/menaquinone biosynthesis C-methylase UbiE
MPKAKNTNQVYFEYLMRRSFLGDLYRRYVLYPRLNLHLNGKVLDVGCGIGDMLSYRKNTVGLDVNPLECRFLSEATIRSLCDEA